MRIRIQLRAKQLINLDLKKRWKSQKLFSCQSLEWETPLNIFYFWGLMIEKQTPNKEGVWYYTSVQEDRNDLGFQKLLWVVLASPAAVEDGQDDSVRCWKREDQRGELMKLKHKHFIFNREDSQLTNELQSCWWGDFFVFGQKQPFWSMKRHQFYTLKVSLQVSGRTTALVKKYKEPTLPTMQINYCVYQITCSLHWSNKMSHATILLQLLNVYI